MRKKSPTLSYMNKTDWVFDNRGGIIFCLDRIGKVLLSTPIGYPWNFFYRSCDESWSGQFLEAGVSKCSNGFSFSVELRDAKIYRIGSPV